MSSDRAEAVGTEPYARFSVVHGGPMMHLMARLGIERPSRRIPFLVLATWVPLLILSTVSTLLGGDELKHFLTDLALRETIYVL